MTTEDAPSDKRPAIPDSEIIERFGGIRPMAAKLGVAVTTVQGWKERDHIPPGRWQQIADSAAAQGIDLGAEAAAPAAPPTETPAAPEESAAPRGEAAAKTEFPKPESAEEPHAAPQPSPTKESTPKAAPAAKPASTRIPAPGIAWLALAVALALGVAMLTRPYWETAIHGRGFTGAGAVDPAAVDRIVADLESAQEAIARIERDAGSRAAETDRRIAALEAGGGEAGAQFASQLAALDEKMARLSRSLETISGSADEIARRLAALESAQGRVSEPVQRELTEITSRIDRLQSDLKAQQAELQAGLAAMTKTTGDLESRVTELETRPVQTGKDIAALVLAIGQLSAALDSGRPYRAALERLRALGHDDPLIAQADALAVLAPWADIGIPDRLALRRRFTEIAPAIDRALAGTDSQSWLDSVWSNLRGLVTVRKVGGAGDLPPLSQAEIAMERGDLVAAKTALEGAGPLGPEGEAWISQVRARIEAETALESLHDMVIAPLAGTAGAGAAVQ